MKTGQHDGGLLRRNEGLPRGDGGLSRKGGGPNESPWRSNRGHVGGLVRKDGCQSGKVTKMETCPERMEVNQEELEANQEKTEAVVEHYERVPHAEATDVLTAQQQRASDFLYKVTKGIMYEGTIRSVGTDLGDSTWPQVTTVI
jgi:hypothetical protein